MPSVGGPSSRTVPCEARGSCDEHTKLSELEGVEHGICMIQLSIGQARQVRANPKNKYKVIVRAMEDIKRLLVQLIEKIKTPKKGAANQDELGKEAIVFHGTRKILLSFQNRIKSKMVMTKRKR